MILLWFLSGILLAFGIARYNKSNKLFWQLAFCLTLGYAATIMVNRTFGSKERSSDDLVQVCPTQMPSVVISAPALSQITSVLAPSKVTDLNSAVQVFTPEEHEVLTASSKVYGRTRDQPLSTLTQPPECLAKVISTLHDTG